ncbi:DNA cytosine methyltransferase [Chryseolinea soli]|uniref:Cytosine-specific methyltransferase n=1 Tax=Chryseolinea soli TaxID=2321403 RepID=A0A385SZD1_9BACT|nr:DNA cytosine methyltransferase [Chryseolinea soli]AYB35487.1 DNA cytosine methyltransferase [Chryseolinea soli]
MKISAIDLFCGIGGLSYGMKKAGIRMVAGIDIDDTCEYAYKANVKADFIAQNIAKLNGKQLKKDYWSDDDRVKILVGCAPCQPFSSHTNKNKHRKKGNRWRLLNEFVRLIDETGCDIVSMENVPNLSNQKIFEDFINFLESKKYHVSYSNVYCPEFGIPQKRRRLVLLASRFGKIELIPSTHEDPHFVTTKEAIGHLPPVQSGEICKTDPLHRTTKLTDLNLKRIKASKPNGSWLDWDEELRLACHSRESGDSYKSVYGRMTWNEPAPTITTQFYNYGTGRFGHPTQDRALTVREAALLQTFPADYKFIEDEHEDFQLTNLGVHIGNAVPVELGFVIGKSIRSHIRKHHGKKNKTR